MSLVKGPRYNPFAGRVCRSLGAHRFDGDTCSTCGIIEDGNRAPHILARGVSVSHPQGAVPAQFGTPILTTSVGHRNTELGPRDPDAFRRGTNRAFGRMEDDR